VKIFYILLLVIISNPLFSQDGCTYEPSSKVEKLIAQSKDTKKYEADERTAFLDKALEEEPNCLPCLRRLGEIEYLRAKRGGTFNAAKSNFEKLVELCPEYHSEPYYFLGAMCYADKEYDKAAEWFEKFMKFPDSDPTKFEKDYDKKYAEVEEALKSVKAYAEIYSEKIDFSPVKVQGVTSANDEYLPFISPDGEVMFITRFISKQAKGDVSAKLVEEFTWCKRSDINSKFDTGVPLPPPFNQGSNCGGATISLDNRELIVAMKNPQPKNPQNIDLFSTRYEMSTNDKGERIYNWGELVNLGEDINTPDGFEAQPSLSGDGQTLIFVGRRAECIKGTDGDVSHDLFISKRQADGSWGKCNLLPGPVNTNGHEKSPFIHSDSHTLYFGSTGHLGVGGMDIFYCQLNADGTTTAPKNIGYPINTDADELGIVVSSSGDIAYFGARNFQGSKGWDIYQFNMPEKAKPERVMIVKGVVADENGNPPADAKVEINYQESKKKEEVKVNSDDGSYAAIVKVKEKENVTLSVKSDNLAFNSSTIVKKDEPVADVVKVKVETQEIKEGKPFVINDIYYTTGKADIEDQSKPTLDAFAEYLLEHPSMEIEIQGHTDNIGDDKANFALSGERAFEVLKYLTSKGVPGKRIKAQGYGETKPIADNTTDEGRKKNRRTAFVIKKL
jgi:outer membrane protein OmpA-like peptidoglycan-associated protein/tetratricopeptide (TPR) repeat protein